MTSESMFNQGSEAATTTQQSELNLIGEGKQYADVSVADKALADKDAYILKLEGETKELRDAQTTATSVDDILAKISTAQNTVAGATTSSDQNATSGMNAEEIKALVDAGIKANSVQAQAQTNLNAVEQALRAQFGDKANEVYKAKSAECRAKNIDLKDLLAKDPSLVGAYFASGVSADLATSTAHQSSINTVTLQTPTGQSPYQKLHAELKGQKLTNEQRHRIEYERLVEGKG